MSVDSSFTEDNKVLVISIKGKFDFALLNKFRQAYAGHDDKPEKIVVDMRSTTTIDSSALGMLLNMQRYLDQSDGDIRIINCNQDVRKVLQITHFNKKFTIE